MIQKAFKGYTSALIGIHFHFMERIGKVLIKMIIANSVWYIMI